MLNIVLTLLLALCLQPALAHKAHVHGLARMDVAGVSFGQDDQLRVLIEGGDADAVRAALVEAFSFPPRGLLVKAVASLPRASSGKLLYGALGAAWDQVGEAAT